jgi:WhiB family redox-sensing transcriptional regulator
VVEFGKARRYGRCMSALDPTPDASWMAAGKCRDYSPAMFFPSDGTGVEAARQVCLTCPVSQACLDFEIRNRIEHGVWGGASERARRRITRTPRAKTRAVGA